MIQATARNQARREELLRLQTLNGIDYVDVHPGPRLEVFFLFPLTGDAYGLTTPPYDRLGVAGGTRIRRIPVKAVSVSPTGSLLVDLAVIGDLSVYTFWVRHEAVDPVFSQCDFVFRPTCQSPVDRQLQPPQVLTAVPEPLIDYRAKDYAAMRTALMDFVRQRVPRWDDSPADLGVALVELLAYVGDELSYYQDAVMNEAWLQTARQRESVRRHALLIDYRMHDGCAARAFVHIGVLGEGVIPAGTAVTTESDPAEPPTRFTVVADTPVHPVLNAVTLYTWDASDCTLCRGTAQLDLLGDVPLAAGDWLLLEQVTSPHTGKPADADPTCRQVVRIAAVARGLTDPLHGTPLTRVDLMPEDALARDFVLAATDATGRAVTGCTVARGNMALAEHGWVHTESFADIAPPPDRSFAVRLTEGPLSFRAPLPGDGPAAHLLTPDPRRAVPRVMLTLVPRVGAPRTWHPVPDLLASDGLDEAFVAETDNDGRASLRFGDGVYGRRPPEGATLNATYWVGNGAAGNVGADALVVLTLPPDLAASLHVQTVRNPLPAWGGIDPEPVEQVKRLAPSSFRSTQYRAVTPADYVAAAQAHPAVSRAIAAFRWTGSWYTVAVTVDLKGRTELTPALRQSVLDHLERYRLSGYDLQVVEPAYVPLEVGLEIWVSPGYSPVHVEEAVQEALGSGPRADGTPALFHPDRYSFGDPVYLSHIYHAVEAVPGVETARVVTFKRYGRAAAGELARGILPIGPSEIARLDNDPNFPDNGLLRLQMRGGL